MEYFSGITIVGLHVVSQGNGLHVDNDTTRLDLFNGTHKMLEQSCLYPGEKFVRGWEIVNFIYDKSNKMIYLCVLAYT